MGFAFLLCFRLKYAFPTFRFRHGPLPVSTLVKVLQKGQVTIPTRLRAQAGIVEGDMVEATFHRGKIILTPKLVIDRSQFPNADDEYTPAQRRVIDAHLAAGHPQGVLQTGRAPWRQPESPVLARQKVR